MCKKKKTITVKDRGGSEKNNTTWCEGNKVSQDNVYTNPFPVYTL